MRHSKGHGGSSIILLPSFYVDLQPASCRLQAMMVVSAHQQGCALALHSQHWVCCLCLLLLLLPCIMCIWQHCPFMCLLWQQSRQQPSRPWINTANTAGLFHLYLHSLVSTMLLLPVGQLFAKLYHASFEPLCKAATLPGSTHRLSATALCLAGTLCLSRNFCWTCSHATFLPTFMLCL